MKKKEIIVENKYHIFNELMKTGLISKDNFQDSLRIASNTNSSSDLVTYLMLNNDGKYVQLPLGFIDNKEFLIQLCSKLPKLYNEIYIENIDIFRGMINIMADITSITRSKWVKPEVKAEAIKMFETKYSNASTIED